MLPALQLVTARGCELRNYSYILAIIIIFPLLQGKIKKVHEYTFSLKIYKKRIFLPAYFFRDNLLFEHGA